MRGVQTHAICNEDFNGESVIHQTRRERDSWHGGTCAANITLTNNSTRQGEKERRRILKSFLSPCTGKAKAVSHIHESWHIAIEP